MTGGTCSRLKDAEDNLDQNTSPVDKPSSLLLCFLERLSDDVNVFHTSRFGSIHYFGNGSERNFLIGTQVDLGLSWILELFLEPGLQLIDVHRRRTEKQPLLPVDLNHKSVLSELLHRPGFGNIDLDSRLNDRSSQHEDDQQN